MSAPARSDQGMFTVRRRHVAVYLPLGCFEDRPWCAPDVMASGCFLEIGDMVEHESVDRSGLQELDAHRVVINTERGSIIDFSHQLKALC